MHITFGWALERRQTEMRGPCARDGLGCDAKLSVAPLDESIPKNGRPARRAAVEDAAMPGVSSRSDCRSARPRDHLARVHAELVHVRAHAVRPVSAVREVDVPCPLAEGRIRV